MNEYIDSSKRLTFDFSEIKTNDYSKITQGVVKKFNLTTASTFNIGIDEKFQDYKFGNLLIGLEWDIWSGYIVVAKNCDSEDIAKKIAEFINQEHNKLLKNEK